jgi:lysophosphatidate acyltransferase
MLSLTVLFLIGFVYVLIRYVLNEKQIYVMKYMFYVFYVMFISAVLIPIFACRPRHASNIRIAALALNPMFRRLGLTYRVENAEVLHNNDPCVIVANHQSSIDFISLMALWPEHVRYCTILAKKELFWALPFGFSAWLAGLEYIDRKNHQRASQTMRQLTDKVQHESLRLLVFPEGNHHRNANKQRIAVVSFLFLSKQTNNIDL